MKIAKRGEAASIFTWANKFWKGSNCGTIVYLQDTDAVEYYEAYQHPGDDYLKIRCPVCLVKESYFPSSDPGGEMEQV